MQAQPCQMIDFFNGTKQMLVPLFQRSYEWGKKNWQVLWEDLLEQYERGDDGSLASHFTGAIVTAPARSVPVGVSKHLVIDGQQRLTTVAILLCAIRSMLPSDSKQYRKITRLLVNEDDEGLDYFKLLPTQADRPAFLALLESKPITSTAFEQAYLFFRKALNGTDSDEQPIDVERLFDALRTRLTVVAINLGDTDDPYLIFESLNAKGTPLTQADLVRNYLLLRLPADEQQHAYDVCWMPMQTRLGTHLTEFMRHYLMQSGEEVGKSSIYAVLKSRLRDVPTAEVLRVLADMERTSAFYSQIVGLDSSPSVRITRGLARLREWEIATANPFILKMLASSSPVVDYDEVASCLAIVESYAVRRAVCGVPTNQLKKIFLKVTRDAPTEDVPNWLASHLAAGQAGRRWPKDEEFREAFARYRAYSQPRRRCRFLLASLEESHGHKEPASISAATIEHIMPQTLNISWRQMLGERAEEVHQRWLDTLPNLTLSGYNSELSNLGFEKKRDRLADSHFSMNRWIAEREVWTEEQLMQRAKLLFDRMVTIWARPDA